MSWSPKGTALERLEGGHDILRSPDFEYDDIDAKRAGRRLNLGHLHHGAGIANISHDRQSAKTGNDLFLITSAKRLLQQNLP
jgi:hypothetical protein